jgi:DNA-binding XRE family transcriptional regulator
MRQEFVLKIILQSFKLSVECMVKKNGSSHCQIMDLKTYFVKAILDDKLLPNPAVRQAYDAQAPEFELALELIAARTQAGLTQGEVAARMGTTQSVVARIESGRGTPSMRTVQRFANRLEARVPQCEVCNFATNASLV